MANLSINLSASTVDVKTASVDIPKARHGGLFAGRDSFAAVTARSLPLGHTAQMLPTPPNSISPSLPPQGFRVRGYAATDSPPTPHPVDSDLDLGDAADGGQHHGPAKTPHQGDVNDRPDAGLGGFDAAGIITSALLAKHHLPQILLAHGPLAIRYVMGYLTTSVPGFAGISPAKARRLVVGALEGRGISGEHGGLDADVEFEKVGWGRWDARTKGQRPREDRGIAACPLPGTTFTPPASIPSSHSAFSMNGLSSSNAKLTTRARCGTSWTDDSMAFSHDEEMDFMDHEDATMLDHEADKMSLDNDRSCSSSNVAEDLPNVDEDLGDITDDEDWEKIGAAALRQAYLPAKEGNPRHLSTGGHPPKRRSDSGDPASAHTMPLRHKTNLMGVRNPTAFHPPVRLGVGSDSQEREAIEALVRLSSV